MVVSNVRTEPEVDNIAVEETLGTFGDVLNDGMDDGVSGEEKGVEKAAGGGEEQGREGSEGEGGRQEDGLQGDGGVREEHLDIKATSSLKSVFAPTFTCNQTTQSYSYHPVW